MSEELEVERDPAEVDRLADQRITSLQSELIQQEVEQLVGTDGAEARVAAIEDKIEALRGYKAEHGSGA